MQAQSQQLHPGPCKPGGDDIAEITIAFARLKTSLGFLELPAEIRNTIYELISEPIAPSFHPRHSRLWFRTRYTVTVDRNTTLQLLPVVHTCRQIRQEVLSLWLPKHQIITHSMLAALRWINAPQQQLSSFVSSFDIRTTRPIFIAEGSQDVVLRILQSESLDLTIGLNFTYEYHRVGTSREKRCRLSFCFRVDDNLTLAPGTKELIISTLYATFEHKEEVTLREFILVGDQLANVPLHVVPGTSSERRAGVWSVQVYEEFKGSCTVLSRERGGRIKRSEGVERPERGERSGRSQRDGRSRYGRQ